MENHRGQLCPKLLVYWLILSVCKVRVDPCLAQKHHGHFQIATRGVSPPATPSEISFPMLFLLASEGLLLAEPAMRFKRRRGGHQAATGQHHFHSPLTALPPSPISPGALLSHTVSARELFVAAKGAGAYLVVIYLQTIEKNPGPIFSSHFSRRQEDFLNQLSEKIVENVTRTFKEQLVELKKKSEAQLEELRAENTTLSNRISQLERSGKELRGPQDTKSSSVSDFDKDKE
jgi:hypothetical protein